MKFRTLPTTICVLIGLVLTAVVGYYWYAQVGEVQQKRFEAEVVKLNDQLEDQLQAAKNNLNAIAAFYDSSQEVSHDEFQTFSRVLFNKSKIIDAFEWAPKLTQGQLAAFTAKARQIDPDYKIRSLSDTKHPFYYFPIYYIEPATVQNIRVYGNDLASQAELYTVIKAAITSDKITATKPVQNSAGLYTSLFVQPVYLHDTTQKNMMTAQGIVIAVVDIHKLVQVVADYKTFHKIGITLYDNSNEAKPIILSSATHNIPLDNRIVKRYDFDFANLALHVDYYADINAYIADLAWVGPIIIILGILLTLALTIYLNQLLNREEITKELVDKRTHELQVYSNEMKLIYQVISIYAETKELNIILKKCLDLICDTMGWPVGHIYQFEDGHLKPTDIWKIDDKERNKEFYAVTMDTQFDPGNGLPGRVFSQGGEPAWVLDIQTDTNFIRAKVCNQLDLHSAFGFGITVKNQVKYVFEFFSYETLVEDEGMNNVCNIIRQQSERYLEKQLMQIQLLESEERTRLLLNSAGEGIYGLDLKGCVTFINPAALEMLGYEYDEIIGQQSHGLIHYKHIDGEDYPIEACPMHKAIHEGREENIYGEYLWRKNGTAFPVEYISRPIYKEGEIVGAVVNFSDITDEINAKQELEFAATHDSLLSLPNRSFFENKLQKVLRDLEGTQERFALLHLDIDNFKDINDSLGHKVGDQLLIRVAKRLQNCLSEDDVISRLAGDEFAVLVFGDVDEHRIRVLCHKILTRIREIFIIDDNYISITASIGASIYPMGGMSSELLIRNADISMYHTKKNGKNSYQIYDDVIAGAYNRYLHLKTFLPRAVERDELFVMYQPIVDHRTEKVVGLETLLRWRHPELGLISPAEFIDVAEEIGEIHKIGFWLLDKAFHDLKEINSVTTSIKSLAVNISPLQLVPKGFVNQIVSILTRYQLQSKQIIIEITEKDLPEKLEAVESSLNKLHQQGYRLYIDDFGTGSSSLSRLNSIAFSGVKIDKSFIDNVPHDPGSCAIVDVVMTLSKKLKVDVVAEGVETEEQLNYLRQVGCPKIQGFYYSKPLMLEQLLLYLRDTNS